MGEIQYKKMSLFDAPEGSILVHACNAKGVWGSGIAAAFKEKYPRSFIEYKNFCTIGLLNDAKYGAAGRSLITNQENKRFVGCLVTSFDYGRDRDSVSDIVSQTYLAMQELITGVYSNNLQGKTIYSNKFNSGMFKVDWRYTEKVLQYFVDRYDLDWVVCDPDL